MNGHIREQERLARQAQIYDAFGAVRRIAGLDCSYPDDRIIGGVVVLDLDTLELVERAHVNYKLKFPYVPGLLAYREAPAMIGAFRRLGGGADVLMVDGFGTNHPRRCGLATHVGMKLEMPAIGVGKSFLCGEIRGDTIYQSGEATGKIVYPPGRKKPLYVSAGHRISLDTSVEIVKKCLAGGGLPEPTRQAHEYVTGLKQRMAVRPP